MNRNRYLLVFDFETDGKDTGDCNITEIAAVPVDLRNLTVLSDDMFDMIVRPAAITSPDYYEVHENTINWHAEQRNINPKEVYEQWLGGIAEKEAWSSFFDYVKEYATGTKWDMMPIPGGQNIRGFDLPICERYGDKYKKKLKFNKRDVYDLMDLARPWFMFAPDAPDGINMATMRDFFGVDHYGAHTAVKDVLDTCQFIVKFLGLHERIAPKIRWNTKISS